MLCKNLRTIIHFALESFTQDRVERLQLSCTHVNTSHCRTDGQFHPFQRIISFRCPLQIEWCIGQTINDSLKSGPRFKHLHRKTNMRNPLSLEKALCKFSDNRCENSFLSFHCFLIDTSQSSMLTELKILEEVFFRSWKLSRNDLPRQVGWGRGLFIIFLVLIYKGIWSHSNVLGEYMRVVSVKWFHCHFWVEELLTTSWRKSSA